MSYQLDTDTCVHWLRGRNPGLKFRVQNAVPAEIRISAVVRGELLLGRNGVRTHRPHVRT